MGEGGSKRQVMVAPDGRTVGAKKTKSNKPNRAASRRLRVPLFAFAFA